MRLKKYADDMKDDLENLPELNRVDIVGAPEREFQIDVDHSAHGSSRRNIRSY